MKKIIALLCCIPLLVSAQEENIKIRKSQIDNYGIYDTDLLSKEFHAERREALRELMPENSVAVFFSNPVRNRSNDVDYEYHQDPNFYYFTGLNEPHSMLVVYKDSFESEGEQINEIIYIQNRDPKMEVWNGKRLGLQGAWLQLGFTIMEVNEVFTRYPDSYIDFDNYKGGIFYIRSEEDIRDTKDDGDLYDLLRVFNKELDNKKVKSDDKQLMQWCAQLRQDKQEEELVLLKRAIDITCEAHNENMRVMKPGAEFQTEAAVEYIFKKNGAEYTGFPSIIGSGENTCILHYTSSRKMALENELIVCDIGAEYHGYTADITRTLPVNGKYTEAQKIIYNIVLEAQQAGIDSCKAGNSFWSAHIAATTIISQRLKELGIIKSTLEVRKYFIHGTSHYLGLDVHDAGMYGDLKPNEVITVEPGIYIPEGSDCDPKWWNIGVRIEDDILITNGEPIILSASSPRTIEEIEAMMKEEPLIFK